MSAEKNYRGSLHKRERDRTWAIKRAQEYKRVQQNSALAKTVKQGIEEQIYMTNVQRWDEISAQNSVRKDQERRSMKHLQRVVNRRTRQIK